LSLWNFHRMAATGLACTLASWLALIVYLYQSSRMSLYWIGGLYLADYTFYGDLARNDL
jgi:hypothetical protein